MTQNIAIFLDLDNLLIGAAEANLPFDIELIVNTIEERVGGRAVLRRAYGDYRQNQQIPRQLAHAGFQLHSLVRLNSSDKNLADMQMVADAVETLIDGYSFSSYVVITGDRDFMPLVQVLRRHDKRVIGIGVRHTTSDSLVALCDEYIFYDDLVPSHVEAPTGDVKTWIAEAATLAFSVNKRVQASVFREYVQTVSDGDFGRSAQGKGGFSKLLESYPTLVRLEREGTTLFVAPINMKPASADNSYSADDLYLVYRSALKKHGLRVVLPRSRTLVLRDAIHALAYSSTVVTWNNLTQRLVDHYQAHNNNMSRSVINDVLRVARRANVFDVPNVAGTSLAVSPVLLRVSGEKALQEAVMLCDYAYMKQLQSMSGLPFEFEQVSMALYESREHAPYLRQVLTRYSQPI